MVRADRAGDRDCHRGLADPSARRRRVHDRRARLRPNAIFGEARRHAGRHGALYAPRRHAEAGRRSGAQPGPRAYARRDRATRRRRLLRGGDRAQDRGRHAGTWRPAVGGRPRRLQNASACAARDRVSRPPRRDAAAAGRRHRDRRDAAHPRALRPGLAWAQQRRIHPRRGGGDENRRAGQGDPHRRSGLRGAAARHAAVGRLRGAMRGPHSRRREDLAAAGWRRRQGTPRRYRASTTPAWWCR